MTSGSRHSIKASAHQSLPIQRCFNITDCDAEPTGMYLSPSGKSLFVNVQDRGTDPPDQSYAICRIDHMTFNIAAKK